MNKPHHIPPFKGIPEHYGSYHRLSQISDSGFWASESHFYPASGDPGSRTIYALIFDLHPTFWDGDSRAVIVAMAAAGTVIARFEDQGDAVEMEVEEFIAWVQSMRV